MQIVFRLNLEIFLLHEQNFTVKNMQIILISNFKIHFSFSKIYQKTHKFFSHGGLKTVTKIDRKVCLVSKAKFEQQGEPSGIFCQFL
jgi:hypothetical protein